MLKPQIIRTMTKFIEDAKASGLSEEDCTSAHQYLEYNEYGLCFDTVITQLHQHDISITLSFYETTVSIAAEMNLPPGDYTFMKELVRG